MRDASHITEHELKIEVKRDWKKKKEILSFDETLKKVLLGIFNQKFL
jgi:hypothetical protein